VKKKLFCCTCISTHYSFFKFEMKARVLIIDDEVDFCGIMKNYFLRKNYEAQVAYTLQQGMNLLNDTRPEILFLDNNLPDGNGWEIVERVVEIIPHIRVYLVSAHRNKSSYNGNKSNILVWEKPISLEMLNQAF
jgi:DNA-binding NtrC family response regulator